jgi:hypothetical protein
MPSQVYNSFKRDIMSGSLNLTTDVLKVALVNGYTVDIDTHTTYADITSEVIGSGYTAGGNTLDNVTISTDTDNDLGVLTADNPTWSASTISSDGVVIYDSTASNALICYIDFGSVKSSSSGAFTISWNSKGILNLN